MQVAADPLPRKRESFTVATVKDSLRRGRRRAARKFAPGSRSAPSRGSFSRVRLASSLAGGGGVSDDEPVVADRAKDGAPGGAVVLDLLDLECTAVVAQQKVIDSVTGVVVDPGDVLAGRQDLRQ